MLISQHSLIVKTLVSVRDPFSKKKIDVTQGMTHEVNPWSSHAHPSICALAHMYIYKYVWLLKKQYPSFYIYTFLT